MISHFTAMFRYRNGRINTTPLSSAATTHFFIISFIFHFCKAASAPGRETQIYKICSVVILPWSQGPIPGQQPTEEHVATAPGKSRYEAARSSEPQRQPGTTSSASQEHRMAAEEGQPLQRGPARDVWIPAQTAPESPRTPGRCFGKNKSPFWAPPLTAIQPRVRREFCGQVFCRKGDLAPLFAIRCLATAPNTPAISPHHFIFLYHKLFNRDMTFCLLLGALYLSLS